RADAADDVSDGTLVSGDVGVEDSAGAGVFDIFGSLDKSMTHSPISEYQGSNIRQSFLALGRKAKNHSIASSFILSVFSRRILPMADVFAQIDALLSQAQADLALVPNADGLEQFRIKWLGANGLLKSSMKLLGQAPKEEKPALGQRLNALK